MIQSRRVPSVHFRGAPALRHRPRQHRRSSLIADAASSSRVARTYDDQVNRGWWTKLWISSTPSESDLDVPLPFAGSARSRAVRTVSLGTERARGTAFVTYGDVVGARDNQLVGYGIVTGLNGTGRRLPLLRDPIAARIAAATSRAGRRQVDAFKNIAAVLVTATFRRSSATAPSSTSRFPPIGQRQVAARRRMIQRRHCAAQIARLTRGGKGRSCGAGFRC